MAVTPSVLASGASTTASTVVSFAAQAAGTQLVLGIIGDDYSSSTPSGFTQLWSIGTGSGAFHGNTAWRKTAVGSETSVTYTIGSATRSVYVLMALAGVDTTTPVDVAGSSQFANSSATSYTTPTSGASTAGNRFGLAAIGGSSSVALPTSLSTWLNSYAAIGTPAVTTSLPGLLLGFAGLNFSGGGTTSSGATYTGAWSPQSRSSGIVVFREASATTSPPGRAVPVIRGAVNRASLF